MQLLIFDKKKIGVIVIIIGLMMVLISLEHHFDENIKTTSLLQNDIKSLKQYEVPNKNIYYKLPSEWSTEEEKFSGGEIIYHNGFISNNGELHGFVQVWNLRQDLKNFFQESKKVSETQNIISGYKLTEKDYNRDEGYKLVYNLVSKNKNKYKAYEYYIKDKDCFIRFAFYVNEDKFKENLPTNFETIVKSYVIKN